MQQNETDLAVKVLDKRHYDRLTKFLMEHGFAFKSSQAEAENRDAAQYVWEQVTSTGNKIKVLIVDVETTRLLYGDTKAYEAVLKDWNLLSTTEFKERVLEAVERRSISDKPRTYRLLKDSVEVLAGTIVEWCDEGHYHVVNPELRTYPEDSDQAFQNGSGICFSPKTVEDQPEWFERVYQLDQYVTEESYLNIQDQLRNGLN